jgi:hypothetical protein
MDTAAPYICLHTKIAIVGKGAGERAISLRGFLFY